MPVYHRRHDSHDASDSFATPNLPEAELEILRGAARERVRRIAGPAFLIGTAHDCDLVLGDSQFPSVHSCLLLGPQGASIRHLGFDPELLVNDRAVDCVPLRDGDRITLGRYEFRIHIREKSPRNLTGGSEPHFAPRVGTRSKRTNEESAKTEVRNLLAEIRRMETPIPSPLKLYVERNLPSAPLAKRIRRA